MHNPESHVQICAQEIFKIILDNLKIYNLGKTRGDVLDKIECLQLTERGEQLFDLNTKYTTNLHQDIPQKKNQSNWS